MEKHPQDKFLNLALVRSAGEKLRPLPVGPRWWGPPSPRRIAMHDAGTGVQPLQTNRIAVMPARPQPLLLRVLRLLRGFLFQFGSKAQLQTQAPGVTNVVAFRRTKGVVITQPDLVSKLPSGSVTYGGNQKSSQEGGRR